MVVGQASCSYSLGHQQFLEAYSIDPKIGESELAEIISSKDGTSKLDLEKLASDISVIGHLDSFKDLKIEILNEPYKVPEQLKAYREVAEKEWTAQGMFNGPVAVVKNPVKIPLTLCKGGYFDFKATQLGAVPGDLLPDRYPAGKTVEDLIIEQKMTNDQRARHLSFAFLMFSKNGEEFSFVQRAKGLGIAADCISTSGGTPGFDERFFEKGFDFSQYYVKHVVEEMKEEYELEKDEFNIRGLFLLDDRKTLPHGAIEITTPLTTRELAQRIYGSKEAIKEHPVLYSIKPEAIDTLIHRFDVWPSVAYIMHYLIKIENPTSTNKQFKIYP